MNRYAMLLSLVALALAGWVFATQGKAPPAADSDIGAVEVASLRDAMGRLEARLGDLERQSGLLAPLAPRTDDTLPRGTARPRLEGLGGVDPVAEAAPRTIEERLAELETWKEERAAAATNGQRAVQFGSHKEWIADLDGLEKRLDLDGPQRRDAERIIERTKGELERLAETPNEDGQTLKELQEAMQVGPGARGDDVAGAMLAQIGKVMTFRNSKVPGSDETYQAAEQRIRARGRTQLRETLRPDQHTRFDDSHVDSLFGGAGAGGVAVAFSTSATLFEEESSADPR